MNVHSAIVQSRLGAGKQTVIPEIRPMLNRDMDEILAIEETSFPMPWSRGTFRTYRGAYRHVSKVALHAEQVVAFLIYRLYTISENPHDDGVEIVNFAVATSMRRLGVGAQMIEHLLCFQKTHGRKEVIAVISETSLIGQLFFSRQGFKAVNILHDHWQDEDGNIYSCEDSYVMQYRLDGGKIRWQSDAVTNRIALYLPHNTD